LPVADAAHPDGEILMQILLVDDDELERRVLRHSLEATPGVQVDAVASGPAALDRLSARSYDAIVTDTVMRPMDGIELVRRVRAQKLALPILVLTANATVDLAVEAMRAGATDFMPKPVNAPALLKLLSHKLDEVPLREELDALKRSRASVEASDYLVGEHPLLDGVRTFARRVAAVPEARVLITGESGTGKSYLARAIHALSGSRGRFVEVSCATLPPALMESELFGHEKGAFTDAKAVKRGLVEMAHGGTILLDEIGALPLDMQTKLLVYLESRQIRRVGGNESIASNARVIAATNDDLRQAVRAGRFRGDLLYRLDVASVEMPPLREMPVVIPELVHRFAAEQAEQLGRPVPPVDEASLRVLQSHSWPGNARELRNVVERAMIFHESGPLVVEAPRHSDPAASPDSVAVPRGITLEEVERRYLEDALTGHDGDLSSLAGDLGISRKTLWEKRRRYGLPDVGGARSRGDGA
jgi:two-component system response regulator AtoC